MIQHCPVLIVLLPLTAALLCLLFSKFNKNLGSWLVIGSIAGSLACSLQVLHQTLTSGEAIHYWICRNCSGSLRSNQSFSSFYHRYVFKSCRPLFR